MFGRVQSTTHIVIRRTCEGGDCKLLSHDRFEPLWVTEFMVRLEFSYRGRMGTLAVQLRESLRSLMIFSTGTRNGSNSLWESILKYKSLIALIKYSGCNIAF